MKTKSKERSLRGEVVNMLECGIEGSEFELESDYHVLFRNNNLKKVMNSIIPLGMD